MGSIAAVGEGEEREGQGEGPSILPIVTLASNILSPVAPVGQMPFIPSLSSTPLSPFLLLLGSVCGLGVERNKVCTPHIYH